MVEIECHLCGEKFSPSQCIDTDKYDGEVICPKCKVLLRIKLVKGKLQGRRALNKAKTIPAISADDIALVVLAAQEEERRMLKQVDDKQSKGGSTKE